MESLENSSQFTGSFNHVSSSMKEPLHLEMKPVDVFLDSLGVCAHFSASAEREIDLTCEAGIRHIRNEIPWESVEKEPGQFELPPKNLDWIDLANARGVQILLALGYGNSIYPDLGIGSRKFPEENFELFGRYVDFIVTHLKHRINGWEIWNKPNWLYLNRQYGGDWRGGGWVESYVRLADIILGRIRAIDASAFVVTAGLEPPVAELIIPFLNKRFDALGVQPFCHPLLPEYFLPSLMQLRGALKRKRLDIPLIATEQGYPAVGGTGKFVWRHSATITPLDQARFLLRVFCGNFLHGVPRTYWYNLVCDGGDPDNELHNYGLVDHGTLSPRPAYQALKNLTSVLNRKSDYEGASPDSIRGRSTIVHFDPSPSHPPRGILLSRDAGHYFLILWEESKSKDLLEVNGPDPQKRVFHDDGAPEVLLATFTSFFSGSLRATVIDPVEGMSSEKPIRAFSQGVSHVIEIPLKESPVIVEITCR
ncbi:hypothetical protein JW926_01620 [Candidatus Sumerlaeota bacterium]|nr:hypothetical protein [Candidatus Sumerlaeota bacterium]